MNVGFHANVQVFLLCVQKWCCSVIVPTQVLMEAAASPCPYTSLRA